MPVTKNKAESFPQRASHVVGQTCVRLDVSNYGEQKTSWTFYTRSENYAEIKKQIILKISPEAIIETTTGVINFIPIERAE
jgi:hypothetical protein